MYALVKIVEFIDQICSAHATMCTRFPKKEGFCSIHNARYHSFDTNTFPYAANLLKKNWVNVAEVYPLYFANNFVSLFY